MFAPIYVVSEYAVRRPIRALAPMAERDHWADTIQSLFTFGRNHNQIIFPTALFDFGLLPSVGLYYSGDDLFVAHNTVRAHAATWGKPWIVGTVADRYALDESSFLQARFEFRRAEDNVFFGIGPDV